MYEIYVVQRLLEELELAQASTDPIERSVHQRASGYYRDLLHLFDRGRSTTRAILAPPPAQELQRVAGRFSRRHQ